MTMWSTKAIFISNRKPLEQLMFYYACYVMILDYFILKTKTLLLNELPFSIITN